jgi:hypothetical protein
MAMSSFDSAAHRQADVNVIRSAANSRWAKIRTGMILFAYAKETETQKAGSV